MKIFEATVPKWLAQAFTLQLESVLKTQGFQPSLEVGDTAVDVMEWQRGEGIVVAYPRLKSWAIYKVG